MKRTYRKIYALFLAILLMVGGWFPSEYAAGDQRLLPSTAISVQAATSYSYKPARAVEYADKYWSDYSPYYPNYNAIGGDCANFTSQCLAAGGLPMTNSWYHAVTGINRSSSWTYAQGLYDYLSSNCGTVVELYPNSTKSSGFSNKTGSKELKPQSILHVGDAVFYYSTAKKRYAHAAICVGFASDGTPLVSAHNSNRNHVTWNLGKGWHHWAVVQIKAKQTTEGLSQVPESSLTYTGELWKTKVNELTIYSAMKSSSVKLTGIYNSAVIPISERKTIGNVIWGKTMYGGKSGYVILRKDKTTYNATKIDKGTGAKVLKAEETAADSTKKESTTTSAKQYYRVTVSKLKLRKSPSISSKYLKVCLVKNVVIETDNVKTVGKQKWAEVTYLTRHGYICLENGHTNAVKVSSYTGIAVKKLTLSRKKITFKKKNSSAWLKVKAYSPARATVKKVYYVSSNTKVATVTQNGKVTAVGKGSCEIKVYARDNKGAVAGCSITVK